MKINEQFIKSYRQTKKTDEYENISSWKKQKFIVNKQTVWIVAKHPRWKESTYIITQKPLTIIVSDITNTKIKNEGRKLKVNIISNNEMKFNLNSKKVP